MIECKIVSIWTTGNKIKLKVLQKERYFMRSFIAIDFSRSLKELIAQLQMELRATAVRGRWKHIDNFHLTLKFLDEIEPSQVEEIGRELQDICRDTLKFDLNISSLGNFPGRDCLRVLWLGIGGDLACLNRLQGRIDTQLEPLGFPREKRRYTPHVTIGQDVVFKEDFEDIRKIAVIERFPQIKADAVYLYKSEQIGSRRVYTPVSKFDFKSGQA